MNGVSPPPVAPWNTIQLCFGVVHSVRVDIQPSPLPSSFPPPPRSIDGCSLCSGRFLLSLFVPQAKRWRGRRDTRERLSGGIERRATASSAAAAGISSARTCSSTTAPLTGTTSTSGIPSTSTLSATSPAGGRASTRRGRLWNTRYTRRTNTASHSCAAHDAELHESLVLRAVPQRDLGGASGGAGRVAEEHCGGQEAR